MAHQDEIVRLRKQEQSQTSAKLEKIEGEKLSMQVQRVHKNFFFLFFKQSKKQQQLLNDTENGKQ